MAELFKMEKVTKNKCDGVRQIDEDIDDMGDKVEMADNKSQKSQYKIVNISVENENIVEQNVENERAIEEREERPTEEMDMKMIIEKRKMSMKVKMIAWLLPM